MLFTSSRMPQSASSATAARKSHSVIEPPANSAYVDGFSSASGAPRKSCTARTRPRDVPERLFGVGHRQEVVRVLAGDARPAEMVGHPARADGVAERAELAQVLEVERIGRADRERDAVHRDRVARRDPIEDEPRPPRGLHVVFAEDLEPGHGGLVLENMRVVRRSEDRRRRPGQGGRSGSLMISSSAVAAALALAGVLSLAGVRVRLAAALALAGVLGLAAVLLHHVGRRGAGGATAPTARCWRSPWRPGKCRPWPLRSGCS